MELSQQFCDLNLKPIRVYLDQMPEEDQELAAQSIFDDYGPDAVRERRIKRDLQLTEEPALY